MFTAEIRVILRLKINGALPLLSLYAFIAWKWTALPVTIQSNFSDGLPSLLSGLGLQSCDPMRITAIYFFPYGNE